MWFIALSSNAFLIDSFTERYPDCRVIDLGMLEGFEKLANTSFRDSYCVSFGIIIFNPRKKEIEYEH